MENEEWRMGFYGSKKVQSSWFLVLSFSLSLQPKKRLSQAGEILREESRDSTEHRTS